MMLAPLLLILALAMPNATTSTAYTPDAPGPDDAAPADTSTFDLQAHQWTHRVLLVFAPSRDAERMQTQAERIAEARDGFVERDLVVVEVVADGPSRAQPTPSDHAEPITDASAEALRERFAVPPDAFAVVLVGKDGTEKRRSELPLAAPDLFATIDAMPMRQREMKEDGAG
jgi:hypothetical protein